MKKFIQLFIIALMCLFSLSSCADGVMKEYDDDDIGLHYELPSSLEYDKYPPERGMKIYRNKAKTVAVTIELMRIDDIIENGAFSSSFTIEDFVNHTFEFEELGEINVSYNDTKTRATFDLTMSESADNAGQYTYYTLIKNEKGVYVVQMMCIAAIYEDYASQFVQWSNFIRAY